MFKRLRSQAWVKNLGKTALGRFYIASQGDWRYPFISLGWTLARWFVPRRSVYINGIYLTLPCVNWITHFRWFLYAKKETEVRQYIDENVREGDVFFDIGGNIGVFTLYCGKRFDKVHIFTFEPEYSNLNLLKDNVILNGLKSKVRIISAAVSDFVGLSSLHVQDLAPGAAVHTESRNPLVMTDEGYAVVWEEGIFCVTVDYICEQMGVIPNAMKIDTDGNEDKILRGATKTLARQELRSLVLEMPQDQVKVAYCEQCLDQAGFKLTWSAEHTRNQVWSRK